MAIAIGRWTLSALPKLRVAGTRGGELRVAREESRLEEAPLFIHCAGLGDATLPVEAENMLLRDRYPN